LDAGADVHERNNYALRKALKNGYETIIKMLLNAGADIPMGVKTTGRIKTLVTNTLEFVNKVDEAIKIKKLATKTIILYPLDHEFEKCTKNQLRGGLPMKELHQLAQEMGLNTNNKKRNKICQEISKILYEPAIKVTKSGILSEIKELINSGAIVNVNDDYTLRKASENGKESLVRILLKSGANVHAINDEALKNASKNGHYIIVKILLDAGSKKNKKSVKDALKISSNKQTRIILENVLE